MIHEKIQLISGELILIRPLSLKDIRALHRMYPLLSEETKLAYRALEVLPRPPMRELRGLVLWCLVQIKLALSTIGPIRQLLMHIPRGTYLPFVAVNSTGQIVGFISLNILGRRKRKRYTAAIGKVLRDDYQGKGLGTSFATAVLKVSTPKLYTVVASVYSWNTRNIHVNEKLGFKVIGSRKNERGETVCTMELQLKSDYTATQIQTPP